MQITKKHIKFFLFSLAIIVCSLLCTFAIQLCNTVQINNNFEKYTNDLFYTDVSANLLTLHYTLADPSDYGIINYSPSLGIYNPSLLTQSFILENRIWILNKYSSDILNEDNQLTKDILLLAYKTELLPGNQPLLYQNLSPSLGTQAQLPILLAEYTFRNKQDIEDYMKVLTSIKPYFQSLIEFEQYKSQNGTFMSDTTVKRIIAQCNDFLENFSDNYLDSVFQEKIDSFSSLSDAQKNAYKSLHTRILSDHVFPAYELLVEGLSMLQGTGKNPNGLCGFSGGKAYYEYLVKSNCGIYETIPQIQERLILEIQKILSVCRDILQRNPKFLHDSEQISNKSSDSPTEILKELTTKIHEDFPISKIPTYDVKYVHKDLEEHLSPAFYLTPPIDTLSPNTIYINSHTQMDSLALFTTLAHEGFPGHLYQTITFSQSNPPLIRQLLSMKGYCEGWATYAETYSYSYLNVRPEVASLTCQNHLLNLCLFSYLDTKIHYDGWNLTDTCNFLDSFGIVNPDTQQEIFQVIVEDPSNYLVYCMGYLHFVDLQSDIKAQSGNNFNIKNFHKEILEIGPCQFPILEYYAKRKLLK